MAHTCLVPDFPRKGHDDVIKWKHFLRYWPFVQGIHRSPVNSPHRGQSHWALMFSLICAWINGWVNNPEAGVRLPSCSLWCHCNKLPQNYNSQGFIVEFCNFLVFYFWSHMQNAAQILFIFHHMCLDIHDDRPSYACLFHWTALFG